MAETSFAHNPYHPSKAVEALVRHKDEELADSHGDIAPCGSL